MDKIKIIYRDKKDVLAIGRLYEFCSNKKFHLLKNDFISDEIGKKALEINNNIKVSEGIDLFEAKTDKDLLTYEKILNDYVTNTVKKIKDKAEIGDEMELFNVSSSFPTDKMISYKINISYMIKLFLKEFNINVPEIMNLCKKPDYVSYVNDSKSFFICSKAKIKYKERIVLIHLSQAKPENSKTGIINYPDAERVLRSSYYPVSEILDLNLDIRMFFVLSSDKYGYLLNNPIRLFIKCLDLYGADIEVNHIVKKFHRNVLLPPHIEITPDLYHLKNKKENSRTVSALIVNDIAVKIIYLYSIYVQRHIVDFKRGSI